MEQVVSNFYVPKTFQLDFDKVNTLEDVIEVLKCLDLKVGEHSEVYQNGKRYFKECEEQNSFVSLTDSKVEAITESEFQRRINEGEITPL